VLRHTPFLIVIAAHQRIILRPGTTSGLFHCV
jgi:hypothetical protein